MSRIPISIRSSNETILSINRLLNSTSLLPSPSMILNRGRENRERQGGEPSTSAQNQPGDAQNENSG